MIVVLASLTLQIFLYSPGMLAIRKETRTRARIHTSPSKINEPGDHYPLICDDHYPLTCTQNGVWVFGNSNTCRFLPLPGSEAKSSNLMMFYEGKKSMSMIS